MAPKAEQALGLLCVWKKHPNEGDVDTVVFHVGGPLSGAGCLGTCAETFKRDQRLLAKFLASVGDQPLNEQGAAP